MKRLHFISALVFSVLTLISCRKQTQLQTSDNPADAASQGLSSNENSDAFKNGNKHVYTLSNQVSGNSVMDFSRASDGKLTFNASYSTGGTGTGGGLGNQGAVILGGEEDERNLLFAVNPGSNSISVFKVKGNGLELKSTVNSGGMRPVSVTQHDDLVFVLNAGGMGNVSGFELDDEHLTAIPGSTRPLSSSAAGAAQISFVNNGSAIVVTEKATNKIITYTINEDGIPGMMHSITAAHPTPFGFATGTNGNIFVSEAAGGAAGASTMSSYHVSNNGMISLVTGPVPSGQSAACWVVITGDGKFAFATNTAGNNLSTYNVNVATAALSLNTGIAALTGMGPIDAALNNNSKYLYILNTGSHTIGVYEVADNGGLSLIQTQTGIPVGSTGLAAK
jgi:6-phosphogluconolactonase